MTDKEIIKALIIHDKGITTCVGCPYTGYADCSDKLLTASLDLVKRQQAEIERLQNDLSVWKSIARDLLGIR